MEIKSEAFKLELAKYPKQLNENAEIVIGKKEENHTTEILVEDKSTHLIVNLVLGVGLYKYVGNLVNSLA